MAANHATHQAVMPLVVQPALLCRRLAGGIDQREVAGWLIPWVSSSRDSR